MTFSIIAKDEVSGEFGVAVQSHWFSVGSVVPWARAGVGAVATQSAAEVSYGPLGLELMGAGKSAPEALESLLRTDRQRESRQVAMVDAIGRVAVHTGSECGPDAGHVLGKHFACQANLMRNKKVWQAMADSFDNSRSAKAREKGRGNKTSIFAERLVEALVAGQKSGGDIRGKQSAAILVVSSKLANNYWSGRIVDLRVEDHPEPIPELSRLLRLQRGYEWASRADEHLAKHDFESSLMAYRKASALAPEIEELKFWRAVSLVHLGRLNEARQILLKVLNKNKDWAQLARKLPAFKSLKRKEAEYLLSRD